MCILYRENWSVNTSTDQLIQKINNKAMFMPFLIKILSNFRVQVLVLWSAKCGTSPAKVKLETRIRHNKKNYIDPIAYL